MATQNRSLTYIMVIMFGVAMAACPSFLKALQILELKDNGGTVIGKVGGSTIHYSKGADKDFAEDHYAIAISNASVEDSISDEEFAKIDSIGIRDKDSGKIITDSTYQCDKSTDIKTNGFGCRFLSSSVGSSQKVTLTFLLKDKSYWNSNDVDLMKFVESSEIDADVADLLGKIGSGEAQMYTLKTCPPDASGKTVDVKTSETCPTATKTEISPNPDQSCVAPNIKDKDGKCISVLQPSTTCADPDMVRLLDDTCGTGCGTFQVQKFGKCQCQSGYIKDDKGTDCIADPTLNTNVPLASSGGGSCSLIRMK